MTVARPGRARVGHLASALKGTAQLMQRTGRLRLSRLPYARASRCKALPPLPVPPQERPWPRSHARARAWEQVATKRLVLLEVQDDDPPQQQQVMLALEEGDGIVVSPWRGDGEQGLTGSSRCQ